MRWLLDAITVIGFFLTGVGTYLTVRSSVAIEVMRDEIIRYGLIILVISILAFYHWFRKYQTAKAVFKGMESINEAHVKAMDFDRALSRNKLSINQCVSEYSTICQLLANGFRKFHRSDICITVKYINSEDDIINPDCVPRLYVKDLCRDVDSHDERTQRILLHNKVKDYILDNTDFAHIYGIINNRPIKDIYFFSNCLPWYIGYKNTHTLKEWDSLWKRIASFFTIGMYGWKLPYRSTLIVPISSHSLQGSEYVEVYLCADSSKPFAFYKKYDLIIMQKLARVLYPMHHQINQKHLVSNKKLSNA